MRRGLLIVMSGILLAVCLAAFSAGTAENAERSGVMGDGISWALTADGVLTVRGTGAMPDLKRGETPWYPYRAEIRVLYLRGSFTAIGAYAFADCVTLQDVYAVDTVREVREGAFLNAKQIRTYATIPAEAVVTPGPTAAPATPAVPRTGDAAALPWWWILLGVGVVGLVLVGVFRRK